jgi:SAM-dependent methyltransferase
VSQLPFPDATFDLVTAVETHYYWPDLPRDVREVMRALKRGGRLLVIAETYRGRRNDWLYRPMMTLVLRATYFTPAQHRQLLVDAGYVDVQVFEEKSQGWICAIGTRA